MEYKSTIQKLQWAINQSGAYKIMCDTRQFYSEEQHRPINMYVIKFATFDSVSGKNKYEEVFKTAKQLYIIFFLRNLWYHINRREQEKTDFPDFEHIWQSFEEEYL